MVDRAAIRWLECLGEPAAIRASDVVRLRRMSGVALAAGLCLPAVLGFFLPLSVALPVGVTLGFSLFLAMAVLGFKRRPQAEKPAIHIDDLVFNACPGLALMLDPQGLVTRSGGRDAAEFPGNINDPVGQRLVELVHVSDRLGLVHALDTLRQGAGSASALVRVQRRYDAAEGRQFLHAALEMSALRDGDGALLAVFAQLRDISVEEALRTEAAQRVSEAQSAHEAKSRFLAAVSHELRTPLNAILGFSDVLAGEYFGRLETDRQKEYVGLIRQSGAHLLSVVNTMLDMSKIEAGRYQLLAEPFEIADVVEACRAMLDLQACGKGLTLTARTARNLGEVVADRRAVKQILINLAGNAIKFTEAGGVVTIDAGRKGSDVVLSVSDTGIGISADKIGMIGKPFTQVQDDYTRQYEGTGLGLSLVKGLVALHGGRFHIESRAGEGTVVTVTIPVDGAGIAATAEEPAGPMVEFPPRLQRNVTTTAKAAQHTAPKETPHKTSMTDEQERENDPAKAKSA